MRTITGLMAVGGLLLAGIAVPASAQLLSGANLLKVAGVVLKGRAILNQGQQNCGGQVAPLTTKDSLLMTAARAAVQKALPAPKFSAMDLLANRQALTASKGANFCQNTAAQQPGILGNIGTAASKLGVGGGLLGSGAGNSGLGGLAGSVLGGGGQAPAPASDSLGGLLGH